MYLPWKEAGRRLIGVEDCVDLAILGIEECIRQSEERLIVAGRGNEMLEREIVEEFKKKKLEERKKNGKKNYYTDSI